MTNRLGEPDRVPDWPEITSPDLGGEPFFRLNCIQAIMGYEGAFKNYWQEEGVPPDLQCEQARMARDNYPPGTPISANWGDAAANWGDDVVSWTGENPDFGWKHTGFYRLSCHQAKLATRLANPGRVAWWGDPVTKWGDVAWSWEGKPLEHPGPSERSEDAFGLDRLRKLRARLDNMPRMVP